MSDFQFGVGTRRLSTDEILARERIARAHDCWFVCGDFPEGYRSWFGKRNEGEPFDSATANSVLAEVES